MSQNSIPSPEVPNQEQKSKGQRERRDEGEKKKRISEQIVIEKQAVTLYKGGNESKCMEYQ